MKLIKSIGILIYFTLINLFNIQLIESDPLRDPYNSSEVIPTSLPQILTKNMTFYVHEGDQVLLPCETVDLASFGLIWFVNDSAVYFNSVNLKSVNDVTLNFTTLVINNAKAEHAGIYRCQIADKNIVIDVNHTVIIYSEPRILAEPDSKAEFKEGDVIRLECAGLGSPVPKVSWKQNYAGINQINDSFTELVIDKAQKSNSGEYICNASNEVGGKAHHVFKVEVLYLPEITLEESVATALGKKIELRCLVDANPPANITWTEKSTGRVLGTTSILGLKVEDEGDMKNYTCTAINSVGSTSKDVEVTNRPSTPIILNSEDNFLVTENFELKYEVTSYYPLTKVLITINYSTDQGTSFNLWNTTEIEVTDEDDNNTGDYKMDYLITDLNNQNIYEIVVFAENKFGRSKGSKKFSITPIAPMPHDGSYCYHKESHLWLLTIFAYFVFKRINCS